ncbi:MAG: DHH family phosphoesterase, partial [Candidatus Sumerlaeia bacterium]|nr:DHH family phosphoesterase [Candidatus Sumerlaeia bacterium]
VVPSHPESRYPFSQLAGVGVAYKLITALCEALKINASQVKEFLNEQLDLVALGTIADIVPLISENRTLVRAGLEKITRTTNLGLSQLLSQASLTNSRISSRQVAFYLAPRLNAAGRTAHASLAVDLLICDDRQQAQHLAKQLNRLNDHRHRLEEEIYKQCLRQIEANVDLDNEVIIVTAQEGWHEGLLGLVASKITDLLHRPAFVLNLENEHARGSGRSCGEFSIFYALHHCKNILVNYGGHHFACGVKLLAQDLPKFRYMLNEYAQAHLDKILINETLLIDTEVSAKELNLELMEAIEELEPFGEGNPPPVFLLKKVYLIEPPRVVGNNHLKLLITDKERTLSAIGFDMGSLLNRLKNCYKRSPINLVFEPIRSNWRSEPTVEIKIKDIQV